MVKPFDNTISVILCEKDIGRVRAGACNRKAIKCRHTCKFTGNIEAISSVSGDGIRAIGLVSDSTSPSVRPKIVTIRIILGNEGIAQTQGYNRVAIKTCRVLKFANDRNVTGRIHYDTVCNVSACAAGAF